MAGQSGIKGDEDTKASVDDDIESLIDKYDTKEKDA